MVANIRGYTANYNFKLINFDTPRWHTLEYANWNQLDAMFLQVGVPGIRGEWQNSTDYIAGERVFDAQTAVMYRCLVDHTSPPTGTFEDARNLQPTYWTLQTLGVPQYRGGWASGVHYSLGDIVNVDDYTYYLCIVQHTSSTTFTPDILFWVLTFNGKPLYDATTQAAADAQQDADAAASSATAAINAASSASTNANAASNSAIAAASSATDAANSASTATTQATNAAASAVTAANQAAALRGTSTTSNAIGIGAKSFTTQAGKQFNVGNFMTIVDTANPSGNMMTGTVTSYSGTTLIVNITGKLGAGTIADWQLYISGMQGQPGADGSGGGGIADAPSDGVMYGRVNATWAAAVKRGGDTMAGHLSLPTGPAAANAVRKDYVDAAVAAIDLTVKVSKSGDTMSGHLSLPTGPAAANAVRKDYVDAGDAAVAASIPTVPAAATALEYVSNSAPTKTLTPGAAWAAAAPITITDAATVAPPLATGIDFIWTVGAAGRTLANPSGGKAGQKGLIFLAQPGGGGATIASWGNAYKFPGGIKPVLTPTGNAVDIISYCVGNDNLTMWCSFSAGMS
jgi:hypothetical protein